MKKIIYILLITLIITACENKNAITETPINTTSNEEEITKQPDEEPYKDENPIKVGLYSNKKLIKEYNNLFKDDKDIANFDVYFTNQEQVDSTDTAFNFKKYYEQYDNIEDYKIGFYISFKDQEKTYEKVVLDPDVEYALTPYIYIYLYDDVNQEKGAWYSHITKDTYNQNTIFSSIKLYMAQYSSKITTPITLTVFTYKDETDFDEDGYYRGNSYHTVTINNA